MERKVIKKLAKQYIRNGHEFSDDFEMARVLCSEELFGDFYERYSVFAGGYADGGEALPGIYTIDQEEMREQVKKELKRNLLNVRNYGVHKMPPEQRSISAYWEMEIKNIKAYDVSDPEALQKLSEIIRELQDQDQQKYWFFDFAEKRYSTTELLKALEEESYFQKLYKEYLKAEPGMKHERRKDCRKVIESKIRTAAQIFDNILDGSLTITKTGR